MSERILEHFEISRVKRTARAKYVITGQSHQTSKHFVLKLMSFNSGQLQIRERVITK